MKQCEICNFELQGSQQKYCSNKCKQKAHWNKIKEQPNTYHSQTVRAISRKLEFINLKGGCCSKCSYSDNISALEFHHIDSNFKEFSLDSRKISNTKKETLLQELDKCILLCANCHRDLHNPELRKNNILNLIGPVAQ